MKTFKLWAAIVIIVSMAIGCHENEPAVTTSDPRGENYEIGEPITLPIERTESLTKGQNSFSYNLFARIASERINYAISPMSIYYAIALAANGTSGKTAEEIADVFGANDCYELVAMCHRQFESFTSIIDQENSKLGKEIAEYESTRDIMINDYGMSNEEFDAVINSLKEDLTKVNAANSIWISESFVPFESYINESKKWLNADVKVFSKRETYSIINDWISRQTNGKINQIRPGEQTISSSMVLVNALYVKSPWQNKMSELTEKQPFANANGSITETTTLTNKQYYSYAKTDKAEMVSLNLGVNAPMSFEIILPASTGESHSEAMLSSDIVKSLHQSMGKRYIELYIPQFKVGTTLFNIEDALVSMGMKSLFNSSANFTRLCGQSEFHLDQIIHKTDITVSKQGVEAASATASFSYTENPKQHPNPYILKIDRPFAWQIIDNNTGMVLFCGVINQL